MRSAPVRVGVIGVGHLGSRHAEIYASMPDVRLVSVCDLNAARATAVARTLRCQAVTDYQELIGTIDAVSLAVPTSLHAELGLSLLRAGIHVLIEKPIATTLAEADALIRAARRHRRILQVGHVERFNAAIEAAGRYLTHPRFIEVHRLSSYPFRGTDVSVILDVMVHDLDLILWLVRSRATRIEAVGVAVLSRSEDIANARLTFASGCIANLTASRISDESIRRIRVFQEDSYLSIDSKAQTVELACLPARRHGRGGVGGCPAGERGRQAYQEGRAIRRVQLPVNQRPPLQDELASFLRAVRTNRAPAVSGVDGRAALALALRIEQAMRRHRPTSTAVHRRPAPAVSPWSPTRRARGALVRG